jgi:hypothetical protein
MVGTAPGGPDNPTAHWDGKIVVILRVWFVTHGSAALGVRVIAQNWIILPFFNG